MTPETEDGQPDGTLERVQQYWREAQRHSSEWRKEAREDFAFVAGDQWAEEDKAKLAEQARPVITFNRVAPIIEAVAGYEVNNRQETQFLPRQVGASGVNELLTNAAKWCRDECDAEDEESDAFLDAVICGMGWTETRLDYDQDPDGKVMVERVDPVEMYWDPTATKRNLADARYVLRVRKMPTAEIRARWPEADVIGQGDAGPWSRALDDVDEPHDATAAPFYVNDQGDGRQDETDQRTVVHAQWWERRPAYRLLDPQSGQLVPVPADRMAELKARAKAAGVALRFARTTERVHRQAFVCGTAVLEDGELPVNAGFTLRCMTAKRDRNKRTWYGLVRGMKDPQRWANKWLSQSLHILNASAKGGVMIEADAVRDVRKFEDSWASPAAVTVLEAGALSQGRVAPKPVAALPPELSSLMELAMTSIRDVSGVNIETLGQADREQPGVLEYQRKQAAMTILAPLFDSLRRYRKEQGRVLLEFIQQYISDGRLIRIDGPDGQQYLPLVRDRTLGEYDVVVDQAPFSPDQKERVFGMLSALLPQLMQAGIPVPPDIIDYTPLPASLVQKWKQLLPQPGQPKPPSPEEAKAQAEMQLEQQRAQNKAQLEQQQAQHKAALDRQRAEMEAEAKQRAAEADIAIARTRAQADIEITLAKAAADRQIAQEKAAHDMLIDRAHAESRLQLNAAESSVRQQAMAHQALTTPAAATPESKADAKPKKPGKRGITFERGADGKLSAATGDDGRRIELHRGSDGRIAGATLHEAAE